MPVCSNCGHPNPDGAERCENCNAWLSQEDGSASRQDVDENLEERVRALLDKGQKIAAVKVYRDATNAGLAEAKAAVEAIERGARSGATASGGLDDEVLSLLRRGQKIGAIKLYREQTGAGLKEAKDAVEALARQHGIQATGAGCGGATALLLLAAGMLFGLALVFR